MTQAADADHRARRAGPQERARAIDRVVGRDAGIGQRCRIDRIEIAERNEILACRYQQILGHAAIGTETAAAQGALVHAVVLFTREAHATPSAAPRAVDRDALADLDAARAAPSASTRSGVLVAEREGRLEEAVALRRLRR